MSTTPDLTEVYDRLRLSRTARQVVESIRGGQPVRRAKSGRKNVVTRFPSRRMGTVLQAESRYAELVLLYRWEWSDHWREYYDQPHELVQRYRTKGGRNTGVRHVPDFFLLTEDYAGFVECKTPSEAIRIADQAPERLTQASDGVWYSPAGVRAANELGLHYGIYVPGREDVTLARNVRTIWSYIDSDPTANQTEQINDLVNQLATELVCPLNVLIHRYGPEVVHYAIAHHHIYCDLENELLSAPDRAYAYCDKAFAATAAYAAPPEHTYKPPTIDVRAGEEVVWDSVVHQVINVGEGRYTLKGPHETLSTISEAQLTNLIQQGRIQARSQTGSSETPLTVLRRQHSPDQIRRATERAVVLDAYEAGEDWAKRKLPPRTARCWRQRMREAERVHGDAFYGLIDQRHRRGNANPKICPENHALIQRSIREDYARSRAPTVRQAYEHYVIRCRDAGLIPANYETYRAAIKKCDKKAVTTARSGERAAYQQGPEPAHNDPEDPLVPAHGEHAWAVAHADHTRLPVELVSGVSGERIGTVWLSALVDAFSRVVLAHVLTFESPSHRVLMLLLRDCVRRWQRLPESIVVDRGKEFESLYFESLCARYRVAKIERPPGHPRHGAIIESHFGTTEASVIRALIGNRTNDAYGRSVSATHRPERHAQWTADDLDEVLEEYFYTVYPSERHSGIDDFPERLFRESQVALGRSNATLIPFDHDFYVATLPSVRGGTRLVRGGQLEVNHLVYLPRTISATNHNGERVPVRHDPYDPTRVYAYMAGDWHEFVTQSATLRQARDLGLKHLSLEIQGRAWNTGRQYRRTSRAWLDFMEWIRSREADQGKAPPQNRDAQLPQEDRGGPARRPDTAKREVPSCPEDIPVKGRRRSPGKYNSNRSE